MTLVIDKDPQNAHSVRLRYTYGPVTVEFREDTGHMTSALADLTRVLDEIKQGEQQ
jgi:hypothetical protein